VRARGLKHCKEKGIAVISSMSRSVRARGLKQEIRNYANCILKVALRAGAWIETIAALTANAVETPSRSVRARGLKQSINLRDAVAFASRSVRARGLKHVRPQ